MQLLEQLNALLFGPINLGTFKICTLMYLYVIFTFCMLIILCFFYIFLVALQLSTNIKNKMVILSSFGNFKLNMIIGLFLAYVYYMGCRLMYSLCLRSSS